MKVMLLRDVYKLGRAGDIKKVADGFGRNYLIPQGLAALASPGVMKQAEHIRAKADTSRNMLNEEMSGVASKLNGATLVFSCKAGETGKLYGSITTQMISDALKDKYQVDLEKRQVEVEPIRMLGEHKAHVRLTVDLVPEIKVIVYREVEAPLITGNDDIGQPVSKVMQDEPKSNDISSQSDQLQHEESASI